MRASRRCFVLALALVCSAGALAQTTGGIDGRVTDSVGATLPGAAVEVASASLQGTRTVKSGPDGAYRIPAAPPGDYLITARLRNFRSIQKTTTVRLGAIASVDFALEPAAEEKVVVSGTTPLIDRTSTTTGTSYTSQVIQRLPVGRNYADVIQANPGVSNDVSGSTDGRFLTLSVYGATSNENQWIVDGVNTTQGRNGSQGKAFNNEFVQEVAVMTGGYSAEYGRAFGGIVNAVTKSGG